MSSTFQHRHYVKLAGIIADMSYNLTEAEHKIVARKFAEGLRGTNPAYNADRFYAAAMGEPSNGRDKQR